MSTVRLGRKLAGQRVLCCEVIPHVPDAWVDESKTKVGYEIPLNRHFYVYEPPRPLEEIESDLQATWSRRSRACSRDDREEADAG